MQPWSFNQPVLLNKSRRNRSVLVWTIAGATAFAGAWAFLAPLPETVALQGKLQPARPVQDIESAVDGLVAAVPVKEGDSVAVGDLLVRFDAREGHGEAATGSERAGLGAPIQRVDRVWLAVGVVVDRVWLAVGVLA